MAKMNAERAFLLCCIANNNLVDLATIQPDQFYFKPNAAMWAKFQEWRRAGRRFDLVTISADFPSLPPDYFAAEESEAIGSLLSQYERIIRENTAIIAAQTICKKFGQEQPEDAVDFLSRFQAAANGIKISRESNFVDLSAVVKERIDSWKSDLLTGKESRRFFTGYGSIDDVMGGLEPSTLTIVAARPSLGKSSLCLNIAKNLAFAGHSVAYQSLEDAAPRIAARFLAVETEVSAKDLAKGMMPEGGWVELQGVYERLLEANFKMDDTAGLSSDEIMFNARMLHAKKKIDVLFIDHIQLIREKKWFGSRADELSLISNRLKRLAKELDAAVVVCCQLNRETEHRTEKRPTLSDLRGSGEIEQDADAVMLMYRESYYEKPKEQASPAAENDDVEIIFAKQRDGDRGRIAKLRFIKHLTKFIEIPEVYSGIF